MLIKFMMHRNVNIRTFRNFSTCSMPTRMSKTDNGYTQLTISDNAICKDPEEGHPCSKCTFSPSEESKRCVQKLVTYLRATLQGVFMMNRMRETQNQQVLALMGLRCDGACVITGGDKLIY